MHDEPDPGDGDPPVGDAREDDPGAGGGPEVPRGSKDPAEDGAGFDLTVDLERAEASGAHVPGPPWILGHRGSPREAPENTLASLRRALQHGVDGFEYDVRACADGELVLLHDATLERTTDARGALATRHLGELFGIDAGSWFGRRFAGEPVPALDEALELLTPGGEVPWHMIELKEDGLVPALVQRLTGHYPAPPVRVASFSDRAVLDARDAGLPTMLLRDRFTDEDVRFVALERFTAVGGGPGSWRDEAFERLPRGVERWAWSVDAPADLLECCRLPLTGFNTNEPHRALAVRALVALAPDHDGAYPVRPRTLVVEPESLDPGERARGEWFGRWDTTVDVENPFPFPVEVRVGLFPRSGAFEFEGLPRVLELAPRETRALPLRLFGGSRSPGPDPLVGALFTWRGGSGAGPRPLGSRAGDGAGTSGARGKASGAQGSRGQELRAGGRLLLDAPLVRERHLHLTSDTLRLVMLAERAGERAPTVTLQRRGGQLSLRLEDPAGLRHPRLVARLGDEWRRGSPGLRLPLPRGFDFDPRGLPFSVAVEGERAGRPARRRWAGGLPEGLGHGAPGRLLPGSHG